mmetsp:Transcript_63816/g.150991  ORF Transcript_63816/g.150991 Transcript_63816/m.150991 type:complete len:470 (+) Transcript_63816:42-1451(+)
MPVVKFFVGDDLRRIVLNDDARLVDVHDTVRERFGLTSKLKLTYEDDEGDVVTTGSDDDLHEAFRMSGNLSQCLRFSVTVLSNLVEEEVGGFDTAASAAWDEDLDAEPVINEDEVMRMRCAGLEGALYKAEREMQEAKQQGEELAATLRRSLDSERTERKQDQEASKSRVQDLLHQLESLKAELQAKAERDKKETKRQGEEVTLRKSLESERAQRKKDQETSDARIHDLLHQVGSLQEDLQEQTKQLDRMRAQGKKWMRKELRSTRAALHGSQSELKESQSALKESQSELKASQSALKESNAERDRLQGEKKRVAIPRLVDRRGGTSGTSGTDKRRTPDTAHESKKPHDSDRKRARPDSAHHSGQTGASAPESGERSDRSQQNQGDRDRDRYGDRYGDHDRDRFKRTAPENSHRAPARNSPRGPCFYMQRHGFCSKDSCRFNHDMPKGSAQVVVSRNISGEMYHSFHIP